MTSQIEHISALWGARTQPSPASRISEMCTMPWVPQLGGTVAKGTPNMSGWWVWPIPEIWINQPSQIWRDRQNKPCLKPPSRCTRLLATYHHPKHGKTRCFGHLSHTAQVPIHLVPSTSRQAANQQTHQSTHRNSWLSPLKFKPWNHRCWVRTENGTSTSGSHDLNGQHVEWKGRFLWHEKTRDTNECYGYKMMAIDACTKWMQYGSTTGNEGRLSIWQAMIDLYLYI